MLKSMNVCVTGAAGQIAYSFIPQLLSGNVFPNTLIRLKLLDIAQSEMAMKGVIMEIHDCAYPLLESVESTTDTNDGFKDADVIVFLGGFPRKKGMERKDLMQLNKKIFIKQAQALGSAKPDVRCVVVANPANTNAYILSKYSQIPKKNITCLTRLDHNRAVSQISVKTGVKVEEIDDVFVFGNHSLTQYPCIESIRVKGKPIADFVDEKWLKWEFISNVQKRGGEIIEARGNSSVFSAANAVVHHLKDWYSGSDRTVSMGIMSNGEYDIPKGIWSSIPVKCSGGFKFEVVEGIELSEFGKDNI